MKLRGYLGAVVALFFTCSANAESISGQFNQDRYLAGFEAPFRTSGDFHLIPEKGLAWVVTSPFPSRLIMNEHGITQIANGAVTQSSSGGVGKVISEMIYPAMANDWEGLSKNFTVDVRKVDNKWKATLLPKHSRLKEYVTEIIVEGSETTELLTIKKARGDYDRIAFSNQVISPSSTAEALEAFQYEAQKQQ
ncbi:hypothetical protein GUA87_06630 [Sneathiella sp. P13V-1]|uniref:outer membrane lipoprotein carrier protein LolA n=1 Tax=Sneathiella sp. P13V-1 TaxID=2697366 RepID=UPI00187B3803|nr:outer membrane lipoprotein carrier protein LolA [Sneathiella sp. P13V-1]MBE7636515.1 hypothetical protein [Sneathiella sp. P13V-1]